MGVSPRPKWMQKKLAEIDALVERQRVEEARRLLDEVRTHLGDSDSTVVALSGSSLASRETLKTIAKSSDGPDCLVEAKAGAFAAGYVWPPPIAGCSDEIRRRLLEEQGGLCAYCMQRIQTTKMKIEHCDLAPLSRTAC